jgi:hypothetical protein
LTLRTQSWQDKYLVWFKGQAWRPVDLPMKVHKDGKQAKFDPLVSTFSQVYTFVQFWFITYAALLLQAEQGNLPRSLVLSAFALLVGAVCVQGYWLEGRKRAFLLEWVRLGVLLGITLGAQCSGRVLVRRTL